MNIRLIGALKEHQHVIANMMQFYMYDFSEYTGADPEPHGLFAEYPHLDDYWKERGKRFTYLIQQDDRLIGFILIRLIESAGKKYFSIAEFFIMRKYQRKGYGTLAAKLVFDLHRGPWEVFQMETNKPAQVFWRKVIHDYAQGQFQERIENRRTIQNFTNGSAEPAS
jgi:predicted acetyltransferase